MKMKLSRFLFLSLVLVAFFNIIGCKDQSVMIYTVAFDSNGGELTSNSSQNILSGDQAIAPSNPKREGCIFTGWYTEPECLNLYDFNNQVVDSFALYAGWARIEYTIVFDSNGGEFYGNTSETIFSGDKVNPPVPEPYNTYCSFTGWYTESECINLYDFNTPVTSSFTLYAGWIVSNYPVIFNANGGYFENEDNYRITEKEISVLTGEKLPELKQLSTDGGYDFTGWYTEPECVNLYNFNTPVTSSFTLYAGWTEVSCYTVSFNANGGELTDNSNQTVTTGNKVIQPSSPTRNEYTFTGWYTDSSCTTKYDFNSQVTSDLILFAGWEIKTYTITFNANGGILSSATTQTILSGNKITEPTTPTRNEYIFTGWYTEAECINLYDFNTPVTSSFTLYAGWTEVSYYTVTFNANGGWLSSDSYYYTTKGQTISPPSDPYSYCSFTGWYTEPECINLYDFNSPVTSSFTLYAGWKLDDNYFSVTFNANGGTLTDVSNVIRPSSESISQPSDPIREGYYFTGWYTDVECTNKYEFNGQGIYTSFILYAGWATKPPCTVTFNANGGYFGEYSNSETTMTVTVLNGTCVAHPNNLSYQFMVFSGWYTESECKNKYDLNTPVTKNITLYAGWIPVHSINFESNGNSYFDYQYVVEGDLLICPDEIPENYGKVFTGWYTEPECTNLYDFNSPVTSSFTLYAGWGETVYYTVTFDANGGDFTSDSIQNVLNRGYITEPSNPTRSGYYFTGWYTDINCTNKYDFTNQVTSSFSLYAGWEIKTYVINFNVNGGVLTSNTNQTVSNGSKVTQPSNPTRDEYDFTGWYTEPECINLYDFNSQVYNDFTLYAGWHKLCIVTFIANGGNLTSNTSQSVLVGTQITQPSNPIRDEYDFTGWYTEPGCINLYDFNSQVTSDFTLYAGWMVTTYTVKFDANGGSLVGNASQTVTSASKFIQPNDPIRSEYTFTGWYRDRGCTVKYDFNNQAYFNFTLYAGWEIKKYTVKFNANGGTLTSNTNQTVSSGSKITQPTSPTRDYYYFTDWYTSSNCTNLYNFNNKITSNITLYAGWKTLEEYIPYIFDSLEGEGPHDIVLNGDYTTKMNDLLVEEIKKRSWKINLDLRNTYIIGSINFRGCTSLMSIKIPSARYNLESIEDSAFKGCTSLASIEIPTSVTSIGDSAFFGCNSLRSIEIPTSVTSIGSYAFEGCTSLASIEIPTSVTSIDSGTFEGCTSLTSIEIPTSVTSIGRWAFKGCTSLASIEIPTSVTSIEEETFYKCTSLTSIKIPTSVTSIGDSAFFGCNSLRSIEIPTTVTSIGRCAFLGCRGLSSITFKDTTTWYYTDNSDYLYGTYISVSSSSTNVTNLTDTYFTYYWYKE